MGLMQITSRRLVLLLGAQISLGFFRTRALALASSCPSCARPGTHGSPCRYVRAAIPSFCPCLVVDEAARHSRNERLWTVDRDSSASAARCASSEWNDDAVVARTTANRRSSACMLRWRSFLSRWRVLTFFLNDQEGEEDENENRCVADLPCDSPSSCC